MSESNTERVPIRMAKTGKKLITARRASPGLNDWVPMTEGYRAETETRCSHNTPYVGVGPKIMIMKPEAESDGAYTQIYVM